MEGLNSKNKILKVADPLKVVYPRKLGLKQKYIISLSRIAILLLKGSFKQKKDYFP